MSIAERYAQYRQHGTMAEAIHSALGDTDDGYTFLGDKGGERHMSWDELATEALRRGHWLLASGVRKGDTVAVIIPEGDEFVLTFLGAVSVGIVPVPMYPPMAFGKLDSYVEAAASIISASGARLLITTAKVQAVVFSLMDRVESLRRIETVDFFKGRAPTDAPGPEPISPEDELFLQFTSGSTAAPKGVRVTHGSLLANAYGIMAHTLRSDRKVDRGVTWLPMYHDMGLIGFVLSPFVYRIPVVFIPTLNFVKGPRVWMETVSKYRGTITFAPNFAFALATKRTPERKLEGLDLSCLTALGCGAEPNNPATLNGFLDHFGPAGLPRTCILPCYGMAEATLAMSFVGMDETLPTDSVDADRYYAEGVATPPVEPSGNNGEAGNNGDAGNNGEAPKLVEFVSCGRALPGHEILIVDDEGKPLPDRHVGEIIFRGPSVAAGYLNNPEATRETFSELGLKTGDLGYLTKGELFVTGRKKDVLILNGRNYDPQTVEWAAAEIPGVRKGNVVAFTRPTRTTEELVIVAETREKETDALVQKVRNHVQGLLSLPVADVMLIGPGALPKTSSGKLQRGKTRAQYLDGTLGKEGVRTMGSRGDALVVAKHVASSLVSRVRHGIKNRASTLLGSDVDESSSEQR